MKGLLIIENVRNADLPPRLAEQREPLNCLMRIILLEIASIIASELYLALLILMSNKEACDFAID
jgi:hypothetical protein